MEDSSVNFLEEDEKEEAIKFAEYVTEKAKELGISEDYFLFEFM